MDLGSDDKTSDEVIARIRAKLRRSKIGGPEEMADEGMDRES